MNYGILASNSCVLTSIVDQLHEHSKKINIVDRLSRHLSKNMPKNALDTYLTHIKKQCLVHPVIHIADSDIAKPDGYIFESFGWVCDGSESTSTKNVYKKGYHVTEATVLTNSNHPVSLFSEIYSPNKKISRPSMTLLFRLWSVQLHYSKKKKGCSQFIYSYIFRVRLDCFAICNNNIVFCIIYTNIKLNINSLALLNVNINIIIICNANINFILLL